MLHVNRRNLLASSAAAVALAGGSRSAGAYLAHRGSGTAISSITLVNTSRNATNPGSVTQLIGCPFRKGDIAKGTWPQFQLANGTNVACTILDRLATTWRDGSLKFVPVMLSVPESIAHNRTMTVYILPGGEMPAPSPRRLSDFHHGIEPHIQVDGLDNLSGTWTMDLREAIKARTKIVQYGNGAAGAVWKVRANARQNGADHGQLVCDFYIASLANPDGSLKGLRILGKVKLPYCDVTNSVYGSEQQNWVTFSRFRLMSDRSTLLLDMFGNNFGDARAFEFSWSAGNVFNASSGYSTLHGGDSGYAVRLTNSGGSLPGGLNTGQTYFFRVRSSTQMQLSTSSTGAIGGGGFVSATSAGSGTNTCTPYPLLCYFGAVFAVNANGDPVWLQGAGSDSSDTTLIHKIDQSYWLSAKVVPPYDLSIGGIQTNLERVGLMAEYWPNSAEPVVRSQDWTGERDDLGILSAWYSRHFFTQDPGDRQFVRVISLVGMQMSVGLEYLSTLSYPCLNNGPGGGGSNYPDMPAPNPTFTWNPNGRPQSIGFRNGDYTDPKVLIAGFSNQCTGHLCQFNYYPYLYTGEPWHLDGLLEHAQNAVAQLQSNLSTAIINPTTFALDSSGSGGCRNVTVGSNPPRYGVTSCASSGGFRLGAWGTGLLSAASALCPDSHPASKSYKQYFNDMRSDSAMLPLDILNALDTSGCSFAYSLGLWNIPQTADYFVQQYQMGYYCSAAFLGSTICEDSNLAAGAQALLQWFVYVQQKYSAWSLYAEQAPCKTAELAGSGPISSPANLAFGVAGPEISWTNNGSTPFTWVSSRGPQNYQMQNGDILFAVPSRNSNHYNLPGGYSLFTQYYVVDYNRTTKAFALSTFPGGTPLAAPTDSNSSQLWLIPSNPRSTQGQDCSNNSACFGAIVLHGALYYAQAVGRKVPGLSATILDLQYRESEARVSFVTDPKYSQTGSFTQIQPHRHYARRLPGLLGAG